MLCHSLPTVTPFPACRDFGGIGRPAPNRIEMQQVFLRAPRNTLGARSNLVLLPSGSWSD